jgi:hypothetical protein
VSLLSRAIRFVKELSNAVTLDNVLGFDQLRRSGVAFQAWMACQEFGRNLSESRIRIVQDPVGVAEALREPRIRP